jgi:phytoene dehydrogenase-like protein
VLVSALSETLDRIDVASARKVFVDAFLANRDGWQIRIPTVPLDALYGSRLMRWLAERGTTVRLGSGAERISIENGRATGAVLRSGEFVAGEHFIVAVPHWLVLDLLPEGLANTAELSKIRELETAPISSVHLWFDRPVLFPREPSRSSGVSAQELPHAVLIGRQSQWVFNRSLLQTETVPDHGTRVAAGDSGARDEGYSYQVVISASRNIVELKAQDVLSATVAELAEVFPEVRGATLIHGRLVTEHRAVFSARPGADSARPAQQSPIANLQLAGDWTRTGWPATMEGAVRSGYLAAENVLRQLGRSERIVQPDLPVARLSRLLLGIEG